MRDIKVLHVINSLAMGGAERLVSELLPALVARGVRCRLFVLDARNDSFSDSLRSRGIVVEFARKRGANPYSPLRLLDIIRAIRKYSPNILHVNLGPSLHWCALASYFPGIPPLVITEHASSNRRMLIPFARVIERRLYSRSACISAVSRKSGEALSSWLGIDTKHIFTIYDGIDLDRFSKGSEPASDVVAKLNGRIGIAMTARLVAVKDHETAIRAIALLSRDYCLVLAGDGEERSRLKSYANKLGVESRCLFLGTRYDIPSILAACSIYLQTSRVEGFGISVLEAMAAGLPVVASDAPGLKETINGAGVFFPVGDEVACASAISQSSEDKGLAKKLVLAGSERAKLFSIGKCAENFEKLYCDVLKGKV